MGNEIPPELVKKVIGKLNSLNDKSTSEQQPPASDTSNGSNNDSIQEELAEKTLKEGEGVGTAEIKKDEAERKLAELQTKLAQRALRDQGLHDRVDIATPVVSHEDPAAVAAEQKEKIEGFTEQTKETIATAIEALKAKFQGKIDKLSGPPSGLDALFMSGTLFAATMVFDSILSQAAVGDIISFFILTFFWLGVCMYFGSFVAFISIFIYLFVDFLFGLIWTPTQLIPGFGPVVDGAADAIPEAFLYITKRTPDKILREAYDTSIARKIRHLHEVLRIKINKIKDEGQRKIKHFIAGVRGHFGGFMSERRKLVVFVVCALIVYLSYLGWLGVQNTAQWWATGFFIFILFSFKMFGMLDDRELGGSLVFMLINVSLPFILQSDNFLSNTLGGEWAIMTLIVVIIISVLLALRIMLPESMSSRRVFSIMLFIILALSLTYFPQYFSSEQFQLQVDQARVQSQSEINNLNAWDRFVDWVVVMQQKSSGTYVAPAEQENVHEYVGVQFAAVEPARDKFLENQAVRVNIEYETGSQEVIEVLTTCDTENTQGAIFTGSITPETPVPVSDLNKPIVRCTFDQLPKGNHIVVANALFKDESQLEVPLYFMTEQQQRAILDKGGEVESFVGRVAKPRTSSGPIEIGVANAIGTDSQYELPLVYDIKNIEDINEFPETLFFTVRNPLGSSERQGELRSIQQIQFNLPEGLKMANCDFAVGEVLEPTKKEDGRWITDVTDKFETFKLNDRIGCDLYIDAEYANVIFPQTGYSLSTLYLDLDYTYGLTQTVPVIVT